MLSGSTDKWIRHIFHWLMLSQSCFSGNVLQPESKLGTPIAQQLCMLACCSEDYQPK